MKRLTLALLFVLFYSIPSALAQDPGNFELNYNTTMPIDGYDASESYSTLNGNRIKLEVIEETSFLYYYTRWLPITASRYEGPAISIEVQNESGEKIVDLLLASEDEEFPQAGSYGTQAGPTVFSLPRRTFLFIGKEGSYQRYLYGAGFEIKAIQFAADGTVELLEIDFSGNFDDPWPSYLPMPGPMPMRILSGSFTYAIPLEITDLSASASSSYRPRFGASNVLEDRSFWIGGRRKRDWNLNVSSSDSANLYQLDIEFLRANAAFHPPVISVDVLSEGNVVGQIELPIGRKRFHSVNLHGIEGDAVSINFTDRGSRRVCRGRANRRRCRMLPYRRTVFPVVKRVKLIGIGN